MKKLRALSQRYTVPFIIAIALLITVSGYTVSRLICLLPWNELTRLLHEVVGLLWPMGVTLLVGYGFVFRRRGFGTALRAGWVYLAFYLLLLAEEILTHVGQPDVQWQPIGACLVSVVEILAIGIREEFLFRGIIVNATAARYAHSVRGLWWAAILSSLVFGFIHMTNLLAGASLPGVLVQSVLASGAGLVLTAIYLRGGNIWFMVLLHAVIDAFGLFAPSFLATAGSHVDVMSNLNPVSIAVMLPMNILIALFLLRPSKLPAVFARIGDMRRELGEG